MTHPILFHLHFNTPDVTGAADRLSAKDVSLQQRFGSVRGESVSLDPGERRPDEFRLKLQVHQKGAVNITLAPGQRPHFDHLGLIVENAETILTRAEAHEWSIHSNERRTFVMTPWGFRIEIHSPTADAVTELDSPDEGHLVDVTLSLADADRAREAFDEVFGSIPELRIETGEDPWIDSFTIADDGEPVDVQALLGNPDPPARTN